MVATSTPRPLRMVSRSIANAAAITMVRNGIVAMAMPARPAVVNCRPAVSIHWKTPKNSRPTVAAISRSQPRGQARTKTSAVGTRISAPMPLRKNATVTGSVSPTPMRMATTAPPPIVVDRHAANAAVRARRPAAKTASVIVPPRVAGQSRVNAARASRRPARATGRWRRSAWRCRLRRRPANHQPRRRRDRRRCRAPRASCR